jgi:hypothetical protein
MPKLNLLLLAPWMQTKTLGIRPSALEGNEWLVPLPSHLNPWCNCSLQPFNRTLGEFHSLREETISWTCRNQTTIPRFSNSWPSQLNAYATRLCSEKKWIQQVFVFYTAVRLPAFLGEVKRLPDFCTTPEKFWNFQPSFIKLGVKITPTQAILAADI